MTSADDSWLELLPLNGYELPVLHVGIARTIAAKFPDGWYIAPHSMRWTVGKAALGQGDRHFHILEPSGEPIHFPDPAAAAYYLTVVLKIRSFIDLSDPLKPGS
jgi:hypothetical protein